MSNDWKLVKSNDQYDLFDCTYLEKLTLSKTILKPSQSTNGHEHVDIDEIYVFKHGRGSITVGDNTMPVTSGTLVLIPQGEFHKVENLSDTDPLIFYSIFNPYERK